MGWSEETTRTYVRVSQEQEVECCDCETFSEGRRFTDVTERSTVGGYYGGSEVGYQEYETSYSTESASRDYCTECAESRMRWTAYYGTEVVEM